MAAMKVLAIANGGGSAGKTTTAVAIAAIEAAAGLRVVVVDIDPQGNATRWFGVDPDRVRHSSGDVLLRRVTLSEALVATNTDNVRLVPARSGSASGEPLSADAVALQRETGAGATRLKQALRELGDADLVIVDCPGTLGLLVVAGITAATNVVTVTQPTRKELEGIAVIEDQVADIAYELDRDGLRVDAIVPCVVPPRSSGRLYAEALDLLDQEWGERVTPPVRRSVRVPEAYSHEVPLPVFAPKDPVTADYTAVVEHLVKVGVL